MSPLFAGKYAEGQKMVAAGCVRNGVDLQYSSVAEYQGQRRRWRATADDEPFSYIQDGGKVEDRRVIFQVESSEQVDEPEFASETVMRLPDDADEDARSFWRQIAEVCDPRVENESGYRGLARYVVDMRTPEQLEKTTIDLGYIRVILDDPGAVYENGLLVEQRTETAVGYDMPCVTSTRERNKTNYRIVKKYVQQAVKVCQDIRLPMAAVEHFMATKFPSVRAGKGINEFSVTTELATKLSQYDPSRILWELAGMEQCRDIVLHCQYNSDWRRGGSGESFSEKKKNEKARGAENAAHHLHPDVRVDVDLDSYTILEKFMVTSEDLAGVLMAHEMEASPEVLRQLDAIIKKTAEHVLRAAQAMDVHMQQGVLLVENYRERGDKAIAPLREAWGQPDAFKGAAHVVPRFAAYRASVSPSSPLRVGVNETLLASTEDRTSFSGTMQHELAHFVSRQGDYSYNFVIMLMELARYNLEQQKMQRAAV